MRRQRNLLETCVLLGVVIWMLKVRISFTLLLINPMDQCMHAAGICGWFHVAKLYIVDDSMRQSYTIVNQLEEHNTLSPSMVGL